MVWKMVDGCNQWMTEEHYERLWNGVVILQAFYLRDHYLVRFCALFYEVQGECGALHVGEQFETQP